MPSADLNHSENTFWPWVLGLVLLAAVVWVVAEVSGEGEIEEAPAPVPVAAAPPVTRVDGSSLQAWVRDSAEAQERSGDGGSYTWAGMRRVAAALQVLVEGGDAELRSRVAALDSSLIRIDSTSTAAERVNAARAAFLEAAGIVETHGAALADPVLERLVGEARAAAGTLAEATPLEEQRHRVYSFFEHIAEAIRVAEQRPGAM